MRVPQTIRVPERGNADVSSAAWKGVSRSPVFWNLVERGVVSVEHLRAGRVRFCGGGGEVEAVSYSKQNQDEIGEIELYADANSPLAIKLDIAHEAGEPVEFDVTSDGIANTGGFYVRELVRVDGQWTTYRLRRA